MSTGTKLGRSYRETKPLIQELFDEMERDGLIKKTGEYRMGPDGWEPVYVSTETYRRMHGFEPSQERRPGNS